jgi:hypothetical protein
MPSDGLAKKPVNTNDFEARITRIHFKAMKIARAHCSLQVTLPGIDKYFLQSEVKNL